MQSNETFPGQKFWKRLIFTASAKNFTDAKFGGGGGVREELMAGHTAEFWTESRRQFGFAQRHQTHAAGQDKRRVGKQTKKGWDLHSCSEHHIAFLHSPFGGKVRSPGSSHFATFPIDQSRTKERAAMMAILRAIAQEHKMAAGRKPRRPSSPFFALLVLFSKVRC